MTRKKQTRGRCAYCQREMTRGGMSRHLPECAARQQAIATAESGKGRTQPLYHLQVQEAWGGEYWLHLEMNGLARLEQLDNYLRAIWLECCGHLSAFYQDKRYGDEVAMTKTAETALRPDMQLVHIYDFGTSSETVIKVVGMRKGKPTTPYPIALMARNDTPEAACMECGKPATRQCIECLYETEDSGELCDEHAEEHPHDNYGEPVPLVNSPRMGMCGYDGPAEPPY